MLHVSEGDGDAEGDARAGHDCRRTDAPGPRDRDTVDHGDGGPLVNGDLSGCGVDLDGDDCRGEYYCAHLRSVCQPLGFGAGEGLEGQLIPLRAHVDFDVVTWSEIAHEDLVRQRVLNVPLNRPL